MTKKEDKIKVNCFAADPIGTKIVDGLLESIYEEKECDNAKQVVDYIVKTSTDYLDRYKADFTIDFNSMKCEEINGEFVVTALFNDKYRLSIAILNKMIEL